jgi:hypothetical protein
MGLKIHEVNKTRICNGSNKAIIKDRIETFSPNILLFSFLPCHSNIKFCFHHC